MIISTSCDRLGKLASTDMGICGRDFQLLDTCVSQGDPVACAIDGDYAEDIPSLIDRHLLLPRSVNAIYSKYKLELENFSDFRRFFLLKLSFLE